MENKKSCILALTSLIIIVMMVSVAGAAPFAYITNSGDGTVSVIDTATNNVTAIVPVGNFPDEVEVSPDGSKVYVANSHDNNVSVIDTATNNVTAIVNVGGYSQGVTITPDGTKVYITNFFSNNVSVIDAATDNVTATVKVGGFPRGAAINPMGTKVYVVTDSINTVSVIDTATNNLTATVNVASSPLGVAVTPDGTKVYLTGEDGVSIIDVATNNVTATVKAGSTPAGIAVSPDGKRIYVANLSINNISVIDTATNTVTATVNVGMDPQGIAVSPDGTKIYVANRGSNNVSVIDTFTNTVVATVPVGISPAGICISNIIFLPNPNGWQFGNFKSPPELKTSDFHNYYGLSVDLNDESSKVTQFYLDFFSKLCSIGNCAGMGATSILLRNHGVNNTYSYNSTDKIPSAWNGYEPFYHDHPPYYINEWISSYQATQFDKATIEDKSKYRASYNRGIHAFQNLRPVYDELKSRLASNDYMILGITGTVFDINQRRLITGGHAVVPYKIDENPDNQSAKIYVYDSNHPGDTNRYLEVNLTPGYEDVGPYDFFGNLIWYIDLTSLNAIKKPPEMPDYATVVKFGEIYNGANLLYTDSSGNELGYDHGVFNDEIPGACPLIPNFEDTGGNIFINSYYVPDPSIKMELYGNGTGNSETSMITPNGLIIANAPVSPTSVDEFKILNNGTGIHFNSKNGTTPSLNLTVDVETPEVAQVVNASVSQIEVGGSVNLSNDNGIITIQNSGLPRTCKIFIKQATSSQSSTIPINNVAIRADSTVHIVPSNWNDLSNSKVTIDDVGSKGTVYYTKTIVPNNTPIPPVTNFTSNITEGFIPLSGTDSNFATINVSEQSVLPVANFTANVTQGYAPLTIRFIDLSTNATGWNWNFGDGTNSIEQNPVHTFVNSETWNYTVNLTVSNGNGTDSKIGIISVLQQPKVYPEANLTSNVTGGDAPGTNSTEQNPTHNYSGAENYTVNLTVSNANSTNSTTSLITVQAVPIMPVANFTGNVSIGYAPLAVQFTDLSTNATGWNWNFGDGTNSTEQNPTHNYSGAENYTVNLTVSNANGTNSTTSLITVLSISPALKIKKSVVPPTYSAVGQTITYTYDVNNTGNVTITGPIIVTDSKVGTITITAGSLAPGQSVTGTASYAITPADLDSGFVTNIAFATGTYNGMEVKSNNDTATVTATTKGPSYTIYQSIIGDEKEYLFIPGDVIRYRIQIKNNGNVGLTGVSVNEPMVTLTGPIGDNNDSGVLNPGETWEYTGNYSVTQADLDNVQGILKNTATVSCDQLSDNSSSIELPISKKSTVPPVADFSINTTSGYAPLSVQFTDLSTNATGWNWAFGDGANSTEQSPMHIYSVEGTYNVNLTASNANGTNSKAAKINVLAQSALPVNRSNIYVPVTVHIGNISQNITSLNWNIESGSYLANVSSNGINVSIPLAVLIDNLIQNATIINWNI